MLTTMTNGMRVAGTAAITSMAMLIATPAAAELTEVGVNASVKNSVVLQSNDGSEPRDAVVKGKVYLGDKVKSAPDGALQILLKDQTVFTVGPNGSMTIDEFVYDPASEEGSLSASIASGTFRFMSGKIAKDPEQVKLNSPVATMGIRGTMIEGVIGKDAVALAQSEGMVEDASGIDEENALLVVLRGPGRGNQGTNRRGELDVVTSTGSIRLNEAGSAAFVPFDGSPVFGPFSLSLEAMDIFSSQLRTAPTGASSSGGKIGNVEEAAGGVSDDVADDTTATFEAELVEDLKEVTDEPEAGVDPDFPEGPECQVNPDRDGCGG